MRVAPFLVVLALLGLSGCGTAPRQVGAWCAVADMGGGNIMRDCSFDSLAQCRPAVTSGNRGFCERNTEFRGHYGPRSHRKRSNRQ